MHLVPIHKKGNKKQPGNYRPVSLTSVVGKLMESIVRDNIVEHMMENALFVDAQHGFVPGRSCMTQLLVVLEIWTEMLDDGDPVDAIYLDFRKAFDSVPHQRLLGKLKAYGINGKITKWIRNFLVGRKQRVKVNGVLSAWAAVISGIPQGSVLGPILFVLFINDLPDIINSTVHIFADDTKVYRRFSSENDRAKLQDDINSLVKWSDTWQLKLNADKCKVLQLGHNNNQYTYDMAGVELQITPCEKDLGVYIDNKLKFHDHVAHAVNKGNRMLGLIKNTFSCLDKETIPKLYKALVRPHLEYGNVIWHPRFEMDKIAVEKVQRRATKLVPELKHLPYEERLKELNLPSLEHRRRRGDMIHVYKIMSKIDRVDPEALFERADHTGTRGHSQKLFRKRSRLELRANSFSQRIVEDWNTVPESVVSAPTLNAFKSRLDRFWLLEKYKQSS